MHKLLLLAVVTIAAIFAMQLATAAPTLPDAAVDPAVSMPEQTLVLAGGCFWGVEAVYEKINGVKDVVSGYAGGTADDAVYDRVSSGDTGHAEVVKIEYDAKIIPLETLLTVFFASHDPTTKDKQGYDVGPEYRSIILCDSATMKFIMK